MKYLLVLAVILVAVFIWRQNRSRDDAPRTKAATKPRKLAAPTVMVACLHCGTHLPEAESVKGQRGAYCSPEHRLLSNDALR